MINEANTILSSVDFLEKEITKKCLEIEEAEINYNQTEVEQLKTQLSQLLVKLSYETSNMDAYMIKYRKLVEDEKKTMLSSFSKKKQISLRSISKNK